MAKRAVSKTVPEGSSPSPPAKKKCRKCSTQKPLEEFHRSKRSKDGRQPWCKICAKKERVEYYLRHQEKEKKYDRDRRIENRKKVLNYLSSHPCVDCGEKDPVVLHFDHVKGKKFANVSCMMKFGWGTILKEINKCVVRCANCHLRKTAQEEGWFMGV